MLSAGQVCSEHWPLSFLRGFVFVGRVPLSTDSPAIALCCGSFFGSLSAVFIGYFGMQRGVGFVEVGCPLVDLRRVGV